MLNPSWLRTFVALVALGNFTRAAEQLGLTQAAVSQHLRHLEDALGLLLIRRPRQIELTPAGKALLEYCNDVKLADRRLRLRLSDDHPETGEISLISPGSIGLALYPMLLDLQQQHPGWVVRHRFAPDHEVRDAVLQNQYELGLVTLRPDDARLTASQFAEEPLELVVPAQAVVSEWSDLERLGFINHPDGQAMATRLLSRRFPANPGIRTVPCSGFSNQVGLILEPVARGLGFTVLPQYARKAWARPELIAVVGADAPVVDTLWLIHRAEWPLSHCAQAAIADLRQRLNPPVPTATAATKSG
jgi:DNA-binding transcriptional LysR family regulator